MHLLPSLLTLTGLFSLSAAQSSQSSRPECISHSLPNPIASQFPANVTGTINSTLAILPIPMKLVRSIVPEQYEILSNAWRDLLPSLPKDMYPALLTTVRDHDVGLGDFRLDDFSRASIEFPFIDLLHDGSTSFRYLPAIFLTAASGMAIQGAKAYGTQVYPAGFDPPCNAYEFSSSSHHPESTYFTAKAENNTALIETLFRTNMLEKPEEFPMQFFVNATNQPIFADGLSCDMYTTFWNTTLAQGANAPVPVSGTVRARFSVFDKALDKEMIWADAVGVRVDLSFIEHGPISCEGLKGYSGPGEQKVEMVEGMESKTAQNASFTPSYRMQSVFAEYPITAMNKARV